MEDKDHLHSLIHQLNKGEQSYFRKIKLAFGVSDSYILNLFSIFQKQDKYDEKQILKQVKDQLQSEFFAAKKYLLYQEILDVLIYSRLKKQDVLWQINRIVLHAMILKEKLLFEDTYKYLLKAKKISVENEFFFKTNEINQHLIETMNQAKTMTNFSFSENVVSLRNEIIDNNNKATVAEQYFILADNLYRKGEELRLTGKEKILIEIKNTFNDSLLLTPPKTLSVTALSCYHFIMHSKHLNFELDLPKALYHLKEQITLQQKVKRFSPRSKAAQMGNYVVLAIKATQNNEAEEMLKWLEDLATEQNDEYILFLFLVHKGDFLASTHQYDKLDIFVREIESSYKVKLEEANFSKEIMDIQHLLFCYYFRKKEYKKAYHASINIDKHLDTQAFSTLKFNEKTLRLICAYELNEIELIQKELRGIRYLFRTTDNSSDIDFLIYNTLDQLSKAKNEVAKKVIYNNFMNNYLKFIPDSKYSFIIHGFGFPNWISSKLNNVSMEKFPLITWNK